MRSPEDRYGLDEDTNPNHLASIASKFVPQWLARRAVTVDVLTDRERYARGEPVDITVEFTNRLPVPVAVETPQRRLWGWTVDGNLEASDERRYADGRPGSLEFRGRERKRFHRRWDGQVKRVGDGSPTRWEQATGEVEIGAHLALGDERPEATTTVRIE